MGVVIPTTLTEDQVKDFQRLYLEIFKEQLTFEEADRIGLQLVQFMATILHYMNAEFVDDK